MIKRLTMALAAASLVVAMQPGAASAKSHAPTVPEITGIHHLHASGADEVSKAIAALFGAHGQQYQAISSQAGAFHDAFVDAIHSGQAK